jgi:transposase InsO family protein
MIVKLHANATTTPKTRAYIQSSGASNAELSRELGVSETTIARWRRRKDVHDRSHVPHRLLTRLSPTEEAIVAQLRARLALPLDDIVEVMRRCVRGDVSRSGVHRCLKRQGLSAKEKRPKAPVLAFETPTPAGFVHIDVKYLPPLNRKRAYAYVAIDRATRFAYVEILPDRKGATAAAFLQRFLASFPLSVHTVLTDNGSEFTDRFAVDKKLKPKDKPSGEHPFDRLCLQHAIKHQLTRPFRPQTNGMVERFNRRIAEHLDKLPYNRSGHHKRFASQAELDDYLLAFVADYNRTRLKCLGYKAPAEALANLTGPNTKAGTQAGKS